MWASENHDCNGVVMYVIRPGKRDERVDVEQPGHGQSLSAF